MKKLKRMMALTLVGLLLVSPFSTLETNASQLTETAELSSESDVDSELTVESGEPDTETAIDNSIAETEINETDVSNTHTYVEQVLTIPETAVSLDSDIIPESGSPETSQSADTQLPLILPEEVQTETIESENNDTITTPVFKGSGEVNSDALIGEAASDTDSSAPTARISPAAATDLTTLTAYGTFDYEKSWAILELVNQARTASGLPALTMDKDLLAGAMQRAVEIGANFAHTRTDGTSYRTISAKAYGENIAIMAGSAQTVFNAWMNSSGHYYNIMGTQYQSIGIGAFQQGNEVYYVQLFGYTNINPAAKSANQNVTPTFKMITSNISLHFNTINPCTLVGSQTTTINQIVANIDPSATGRALSLAPSAFTWTSSDKSVATVNNGSVTSLKNGTTNINVTLKSNNRFSNSITVNVQGFKYTLNLTAGSGGSVSGAGSYEQGTNVTISATPNAGYKFVGWYNASNVKQTYNATESIKVTGNLNLTAKFEKKALTPVEQFVARLYTYILNRDYDQAGLDDWANLLNTKQQTAAQVASGFLLSQELREQNLSNDQYVTRLYRTFLNREPDTAGKNAWVSKLEQGATRYSVAGGFVHSPEFSQICSSYGIERGSLEFTDYADMNMDLTIYINRCYTIILNRHGEGSGISMWANAVLTGRNSARNVAESFLNSPEFISRWLSNTEYVEVLYRTFLGREADQAGLNAWIAKLESGASKQEVAAGFAESPEFNLILQSYGLQ